MGPKVSIEGQAYSFYVGEGGISVLQTSIFLLYLRQNCSRTKQIIYFEVFLSRCLRKYLPCTYFHRLENRLYFMKHDPEVKIFYSDRNRYISQEISNTTCRCYM